MKTIYDNLIKSIKHLQVLHKTFSQKDAFKNKKDFDIYKANYKNLSTLLSLPEVELSKQLYSQEPRQMILADIIEYMLLARGIFFITDGSKAAGAKKRKKGLFIKTVLYFVNLLMCYESMTVDNKLRKNFLIGLKKFIPEVKEETLFNDLLKFKGKVGLTPKESDAGKKLNNYFDKILPKTAGGLWHELLVFIFLLRNDLGFIVPLLLNQKLFGGTEILVPPDFLIITKDKNTYGIEVGIKKEIQSGSFSLKTNIPTATIDTINSRCSDRCPICKKWILFCEKVIVDYSDTEKEIIKNEIKCLESCDIYKKKDILKASCPYTKYSRDATKKIKHKFTDGLHYHYQCVLNNLSAKNKKDLIEIKDSTAIKTHYPYYAGLEMLFRK